VVSPVSILSTIAAASNGSQTLRLPMERNLDGARGPRQMRRYLIFCACGLTIAVSTGWQGDLSGYPKIFDLVEDSDCHLSIQWAVPIDVQNELDATGAAFRIVRPYVGDIDIRVS
jgi:hypothetical protein